MKVAIFGSGLMGSAIAEDLAASKLVDEVTVCDVDRSRLKLLADADRSGKLSIERLDVRRQLDSIRLLKGFDVGIGALPHGLSEYAVRSAVKAGVSFVDLIFGWRFGQRKIHLAARRRKITIIPACGLAPGLSNILAMAATERLDKVHEVHIKVGGIPERPKPPLNYRIVFSFEAVLEEYLRKARIVKNGKVTDVEPLTGLERVTFRPPIGTCECFYTDGLSSLVQTLKGVREMDEKTVRWLGHVAQIKTLIECGLLENESVTFKGENVVPREFVGHVLSERMKLGRERDLTLLRIDVTGRKDGEKTEHRYEMIDHYDTKHRMTSMARTTAFPCSIAAQLVGAGRVARKGLVPPEIAFQGELRTRFLEYLHDRGMKITSRTASR